MMAMSQQALPRIAGVAGLLVVWEIFSRSLGEYWIPSVVSVLKRFGSELANGGLLVDLFATSSLFLFGTAVGLLLGCGMACGLRLLPRLDKAVQPLITALMSIPKLGLVPLLVLWFGMGWMPKVLLVALTVMFIVFAITYAGLVTINPRLVMMVQILGGSPWQLTRYVVLPSVWPFVLTGLEVALPWAVSAALVAEYLSGQVGIGYGIEQARQMSDSVGVFYGIVLATCLVLVCNAALALIRVWTIKGS